MRLAFLFSANTLRKLGFVRRLFTRRPRPLTTAQLKREAQFRPSCEQLEDRSLLAVFSITDGFPAFEPANPNDTAQMSFTIWRSGTMNGAQTVYYETAASQGPNPATAGSDYVAVSSGPTGSGSIPFSASDMSKTITIDVKGDSIDEPNETFLVRLTGLSASNGDTIDQNHDEAIGTIQDEDSPPTVGFTTTYVGVNEKDGTATYWVGLSGNDTALTVTVDYAVAGMGAQVNKDFQATQGTLVFTPGQRSKNFQVPIIQDRIDEPTEDFYPSLSNAQNATMGLFTAMGEIVDDDPLPTVRVKADPLAREAGDHAEGKPARFWVYLSNPSSQQVSVNWATVDGQQPGGATSPSDYTGGFGMVTIPAGEPGAWVIISTIDDTIQDQASPDLNERFHLQLSNPMGAKLGSEPEGRGTWTIVDNDWPTQIRIEQREWVMEGDQVKYVDVYLTRPQHNPVTVDFETQDLPSSPPAKALAGIDYTFTMGTLTFAKNETHKTIVIDTLVTTPEEKEPDEWFEVKLSNPTGNATLLSGQTKGKVGITESYATYLKEKGMELLKELLSPPCECTCECVVVEAKPDVTTLGEAVVKAAGEAAGEFIAGGGVLGGVLGLINSSLGNPHPIIAYEDFFPVGQTVPEKIKVELAFGGIAVPAVWYSTTGFVAGDTYRVAVMADAATLPTGTYDYTLTLTKYTGGVPSAITRSGRYALVNDINSPYGNR